MTARPGWASMGFSGSRAWSFVWEAIPESRSEDAEPELGGKAKTGKPCASGQQSPGAESPRISKKCSECFLEPPVQSMGCWSITLMSITRWLTPKSTLSRKMERGAGRGACRVRRK